MNKRFSILLFNIAILFSMALSLVIPAVQPVAAEELPDPCNAGEVTRPELCDMIRKDYNNTAEKDHFINVIKNIVNWLLIATGIFAVAMIIISGIRIITSAGNAEKVGKAKKTLLYSVIGLALALLAATIVNLILNIINKL